MKKHLIPSGLVIIILIVGFSGCIEQTDDNNGSNGIGNDNQSNGTDKDNELTQYNLEEINLINHHSASIDVYVETITSNGSSVKKSFNLDSYSTLQSYSKNINISEEGLLSEKKILVIVTALETQSTNISDVSLNSNGYRKMEFIFNSDGTIDYRRMYNEKNILS